MKIIGNDNNVNKYLLTDNIDIDKKESITLNCEVVNNFNHTVTLKAFFETNYLDSFGLKAEDIKEEKVSIILSPMEKKSVSIILPKGIKAKAYTVKVNLANKENVSNSVFVRYIIRGLEANIHQANLDKDFYKFKDNGKVSIVWSGPSNMYNIGGYIKDNKREVSLSVQIFNKNNIECIEPINKLVDSTKEGALIDFDFVTKRSCIDPIVKVSISDEKGEILDKKDFSFKSNNPKEENKNVYFIIGSIFAILGLGFYLKKKNLFHLNK